jgi:hypothetical protein
MRTFKARSGFAVAACMTIAVLAMCLPAGAAASAKLGAAEVKEVKELLKYVTVVPSGVDGKPTILVKAANVQIESGTGSEEATPNGEGNLIVGYDERDPSPTEAQTGSNNLILGSFQEYTSFGALLGGKGNTSSAGFTTVFGWENAASGYTASVTGGLDNKASETAASVSGGFGNTAKGEQASVSGGEKNEALGENASVSGGEGNKAKGRNASVSGGNVNEVTELDASVSGGYKNKASGASASVSGGRLNTASGSAASVFGGESQLASGFASYAP